MDLPPDVTDEALYGVLIQADGGVPSKKLIWNIFDVVSLFLHYCSDQIGAFQTPLDHDLINSTFVPFLTIDCWWPI